MKKEKDLRELLETGDVVELRNGNQCKILRNVNTEDYGHQDFVLVGNGVYMIGDAYDYDLIVEKEIGEYDIVKIWEKESTKYIRSIELKGALKWERPSEVETVKMTVAEVSKLVGKKVEIIEG